MKKLLLLFTCCFYLLKAEASKAPAFLVSTVDTLAERPSLVKDAGTASVGLSVGSLGLGLETQLAVFEQWQLRVGGTFLPISVSRDYQALPHHRTVANADGAFSKVYLITDWEPFVKKTSFWSKVAISGGIAYVIKAEGTVTVVLKDPYYYGDIAVSPEDVGELAVYSKWSGFAPYLGIGLNHIKLIGNISLDVALGVTSMPSPDVKVTGTNLLSENEGQAVQLKENFEHNRYLPSLQFGINYTFKSKTK